MKKPNHTVIKKLGNTEGVKLSSTTGGQRELIRQHRNKINEIIDFISPQAGEECSCEYPNKVMYHKGVCKYRETEKCAYCSYRMAGCKCSACLDDVHNADRHPCTPTEEGDSKCPRCESKNVSNKVEFMYCHSCANIYNPIENKTIEQNDTTDKGGGFGIYEVLESNLVYILEETAPDKNQRLRYVLRQGVNELLASQKSQIVGELEDLKKRDGDPQYYYNKALQDAIQKISGGER